MHLALPNATIRPYREDDVESVVLHANDRWVWRNLRDRFPHPYGPAEARAWIAHVASTERELHFVVEVAGRAAGAIGCMPGSDVHRFTGEVGYWLGREHWGRGIMTDVVTAFSEWLFEHTPLVRLEAPVYEWNPASARVLEKAGYELESRQRRRVFKDGEHIDQLLYVKLRPS